MSVVVLVDSVVVLVNGCIGRTGCQCWMYWLSVVVLLSVVACWLSVVVLGCQWLHWLCWLLVVACWLSEVVQVASGCAGC